MFADIQEKANELSFALRGGYADVSEAIAWADFIIEYSDQINDEIFNITLCKSASDAIGHLNKISTNSNKWNVLRLFLHRFKDVRSMSISQASKLALHIRTNWEPDGNTPDDMQCIFDYWLLMDLAKDRVLGDDPNTVLQNFLDDIRAIANF